MRDKKTILIVEDNPVDAELTLFALKQVHLANEIVVAHDGLEAVNYLFGSKQGDDPNSKGVPLLIILDLNLPGVSGKDILQQIRANPLTQRVPVVVLTSSTEEEDVFSSYRLGANSFIRKPVELNRFAEAVKQVGLYWLVLNEAPINK
jgi:two-component system response regulator